MLKLAGLLGLTISLGLVGVLKAGELKRRQELLEEYMKMLLLLKSRMNYLREPLAGGIMAADENEKRKAFLMVSDVFCELEESGSEIDKIWSEKADFYYRNTPLKPKDIECIKYPSSFLGQTDYENQCYQFEYTERLLAEQTAEAGEEYRVKAPLYRRLGFFAGGLLSVILI